MSGELTERELFVARLVTDGLTNPQIGVICNRSEHVIKNWLKAIYDKLGLWNRTELALWYVKNIEFKETKCKQRGASS